MAFDPDAYLSGGTATAEFDPDAYLASKPTPSATPTAPSQEETLSDRIKKFLFEPEGAQVTRQAIQDALASVPQMAGDIPKSMYRVSKAGFDRGTLGTVQELLNQAVPMGVQTARDVQAPFGTPEFLRGAAQMGMMATPGLEFLRELRAPAEIPREIPPVEAGPPPVQAEPTVSLGPGTTAGDVSRALERRFTLQPTPPEAGPELAPAPSIADLIAATEPRVSPETGFEHFPGPGTAPELAARSETANIADLIRRAQAEVPVEHGEFAKPGYTAVETAEPPPPEVPPAEPVPELVVPPEDRPFAGLPEEAKLPVEAPPIQTEPVGGNVAGFEKVYGPGEIEAGGTISPEEAWDAAAERATSGKSRPYDFVDRARTGAVTPEEMGDLIYEHHRLVERAAGMEGMPGYEGAAQAAKDFASNVLKPAETAWHQKGMVMQIERPVNLTTMTGMDQLMQSELGRGIKPSEAPRFKRMTEDIVYGESEVSKAVARSDARVQRHYAKVTDIPIEEAAARVKQMLKDCM